MSYVNLMMLMVTVPIYKFGEDKPGERKPIKKDRVIQLWDLDKRI